MSRTGAPAPRTGREPVIVPVSIASLLPGESPRSEGPDQEHVARLSEVEGPLPPILVRRSDMRVIDGMHRLLAALIRGQGTIDVEFFEGTAEEAFLRAVQANITHGLPLSQTDRRVAATRIIESHPQMSDRAIARASGIGAKAVATIRRRSTDAVPQLNVRIGRDGRARPLSSVEGRWRAAELMAENPQASLREVARLAGISPATASDVRKRLQSGELPATTRPENVTSLGASAASCRTGKNSGAATGSDASAGADGGSDREGDDEAQTGADGSTPAASQHDRLRRDRRTRTATAEPAIVLDKLLRDPSLRLKEEGRHLLRLLQQNASAEWNHLTAAVPPHCGALVGSLARQYAATWLEFAQHLDERDRSVPQKAAG
ncbi:transcriptional regulator [Streptomyces sp. NBC_00536]|uniref:ParB/RepB/Spo0J family partition protein n=1 Tax=Streptomyces sp. NBC_00536 TaxID=2975769 RepID=UPI002E806743|nr:ParB N-terminal domain-containing protein [Streptomyces sp. NBC_00536]WUC81858.1 transcriptional regulator [Streptomyces sp. NBC_00536]